MITGIAMLFEIRRFHLQLVIACVFVEFPVDKHLEADALTFYVGSAHLSSKYYQFLKSNLSCIAYHSIVYYLCSLLCGRLMTLF